MRPPGVSTVFHCPHELGRSRSEIRAQRSGRFWSWALRQCRQDLILRAPTRTPTVLLPGHLSLRTQCQANCLL